MYTFRERRPLVAPRLTFPTHICPCLDGLDLIQHTSTAVENRTLPMGSEATRGENFSAPPLVDREGNRDEGLRSDENDMGGPHLGKRHPKPSDWLCILFLLPELDHQLCDGLRRGSNSVVESPNEPRNFALHLYR